VVDTENRLIVHTDEGQRGRPFTVQGAHNRSAAPLEIQMRAQRQSSNGESLWHFSMPSQARSSVMRKGNDGF
jgi:hypothetical protein